MIIQYNNIIRQGGKVRNIQDKKTQGASDRGKARQVKGQGKSRQGAKRVKVRDKASQGKR
jgi:hypothetical protein